MFGGAGNDIYYVDHVNDVVLENFNEGIDTVYSLVTHILTLDVENLHLLGSATDGTGNDLDNEITENDLDNVLNGQSGADVLKGGNGDEVSSSTTCTMLSSKSAVRDGTRSTATSTTRCRIMRKSCTYGAQPLTAGATLSTTGSRATISTTRSMPKEETTSWLGGLGNDVLTGGDGADWFEFYDSLDGSRHSDGLQSGRGQDRSGRASAWILCRMDPT